MSRLRLADTIVVSCLIIAMAGCATGRKEISREDQIMQTVKNWQNGLETKNLDKIMENYSNTFVGPNGEDKTAMRQFIEQAIGEGYLDGAKVDLTTAKIVIQQGKASVDPVILSGDKGSLTATLFLKADPDKVWRIVAVDMEGV